MPSTLSMVKNQSGLPTMFFLDYGTGAVMAVLPTMSVTEIC